MYQKIIRYFGDYKKYAFLGPICVVIDVVCEVLIPRVMEQIVDVGIPNRDIQFILRMGGLMVLLAIVAIAAGASNSFFSSRASQGLGYNLRKALFAKVQAFSFANVDKFSTASLVTRTTNDVNAIQMSAMMTLRLMVRSPIMLAASLFMTLQISKELSMVLLFSLPLLVLGVALIMRAVMPLFRETQKRLDRLSTVVQENLIGMRVVKAFVREEHEEGKFHTANDAYRSNAIRATSIMILAMPMMMLIFNGTTIAALWRGGILVGSGTLPPGSLLSFLTYIIQILMSLIMLSMVFMITARARASGERVIEVLETEATVTDSPTALTSDRAIEDGSIRFDNVSFHYGEDAPDDILSGLSFDVKSGEFVAIVGSTGSGKTSLVNLIPRLYDATAGAVYVGGQDVRSVPLETLREGIGVVLQKNVLFSGTIRDNIKWGKPDATDEEVIEACKAAQAHDFITSFPQGYDTPIEQGGTNVSGGQRQRLCIARAMIKKPRILILDDSTSAVDTDTESRIRRAFHEQIHDTTIIVVAQRISSVREADRILVLEDGKNAGMGTHDELLASNRIYQEISRSQNEDVPAKEAI